MAKKRSVNINKCWLYIDGVTNRDLRLVLLSTGKIVRETLVTNGTRTEHFLTGVMKFVGKSKGASIAGILVAQGGGSFSQARIACAIANALGYGWSIPVATVLVNDDIVKLSTQLKKFAKSKLALPKYYGPGVGKL